MPFATSPDGTRIAYETTGSGPHLLLVHGSAADRSDWTFVTPHLDGFTVHTLDRRGRGGSGDGPVYALDREAEDVAAVAEHIGVPLTLVGHSYGALCAVEAARLVPGLRALVLYEPPIPLAPLDPEPLATALDALVAQGDPRGALSRFLHDAAGMPEETVAEMARALPPEAWAATLATAPTLARELRADYRYRFDPARFREVTVPTLLLLGTESPAYFQEATKALHGALPASQVEPLPGQAHGALLEAPGLLAAAIRRFLAAVP